jgi:hypothetical protein
MNYRHRSFSALPQAERHRADDGVTNLRLACQPRPVASPPGLRKHLPSEFFPAPLSHLRAEAGRRAAAKRQPRIHIIRNDHRPHTQATKFVRDWRMTQLFAKMKY